jgi:hypothetical protein
MARSQELYAVLVASLARHKDRALRLGCETQQIVSATRETIAQSRALIAEAEAVLAWNAPRTGWLWPAY